MQIYTVTHADLSKSGKHRIYFDGKHDWKEAYYIGKADAPPIGARIEANTSSKQTQDGKGTLWFVNDWRLAGDQPPPAQVKATVAASTAVADSHQHWQETEAVLRFCSNVVGSALAALRCQKPEEVGIWAKAALEAAQGVVKGKIVVPGVKIPGAPFDDDIP